MNAYKRYRNRLESYLQTERGKRFINFSYSIGAAIVILGAMFKLLHFSFGNELLFLGMITEVIVFTLSAFDIPIRDYSWDKVFPVLSSEKNVGESDLNYNQSTQINQDIFETQQSRQTQHTQERTTISPINNINLSPQNEEYSRQMEKLIAETEKMGKQLQELNEVYARMLKAMTTNRDN